MGFFVRFPGELVFRQTLQKPAGNRRLEFEFSEQ